MRQAALLWDGLSVVALSERLLAVALVFWLASSDVHAIITKRPAFKDHLDAERFFERLYELPTGTMRRMAMVESSDNPNAVSRVGARSRYGLMPATMRDPGYGVKPLMSGVVHDEVRFAAEYLAMLVEQFDGNPRLALAAYNAGIGAVIKSGGVPRNKETQDYVNADRKWGSFVWPGFGLISAIGSRGAPKEPTKKPEPDPKALRSTRTIRRRNKED